MQPPSTPSMRQAAGYFGRLVRLIRPYWLSLGQGIAIALVTALLGILPPYVTKLLIDEVYPTEDVTLMHVLVGGLLAFNLAAAGLGALGGFFNLFVKTRLSSATRLLFFNHLQHLKLRFFDEHRVGEVTSRFHDVRQALDALARVFETAIIQGAYLLFVPPILFLLDWRLALTAIVCLPLTILVTTLSGRFLRRFWQRAAEADAELNAYQIEVLSHIRTFKAMALEKRVFERAGTQVDDALRQQLLAGGLNQAVGAMTGGLKVLNMGLFTFLGWRLILNGQMSLGDFMAFTAYIAYLYAPLYEVVNLYSSFQQSAVNLSRMFEYLDQPTEQDPHRVYEEEVPITRHFEGAFTLTGISFGYGPEKRVVHDLDLDLPAGQTTALVGPSGTGKTTLLRLLTGLEQPDLGLIRIDGVPLGQVDLRDLRRQIAVVWQDTGLVSGTLWDNLTLGVEHAEATEVDRIVALCGLTPVVSELPAGYQTEVAEWGASLSAGQRQRVALARALLCRAPVLLLDEATANIDVETEMAILRAMREELRGKTVVFVTHRLATASLADQIRVLEEGRLVGAGSHRELLKDCAPYRRMLGAADGAGHLRVVHET